MPYKSREDKARHNAMYKQRHKEYFNTYQMQSNLPKEELEYLNYVTNCTKCYTPFKHKYEKLIHYIVGIEVVCKRCQVEKIRK